jgi:hypothetical protein
VPTYTGPINKLKSTLQTAYKRRHEENFVKFKLPAKDAEHEARAYVGLLIYLEESRKAEAAKQVAMFPEARLPKVRKPAHPLGPTLAKKGAK